MPSAKMPPELLTDTVWWKRFTAKLSITQLKVLQNNYAIEVRRGRQAEKILPHINGALANKRKAIRRQVRRAIPKGSLR